RCRIFAVDLLALFFNPLQRQCAIDISYGLGIEHNYMLESIPFHETLARVLEHAAARHQERARARVSQNEFDLIDRLRGVERDSDGAEAEIGRASCRERGEG